MVKIIVIIIIAIILNQIYAAHVWEDYDVFELYKIWESAANEMYTYET